MTAKPLRATPVERVWGRRTLPAGFPPPPGVEPIGEIWFDAPAEAELLVKYLFTSERLSIQVHPGDEAARAKGLPRGKDEAWYVIEAEPGATIGLGLTRRVSPAELRAAALDGSIVSLLDWRPVTEGDILYSPAGTVHAIGGGIALIEIQQNLDLTYRLYDYGRPRELHLDEAMAVATPGPWTRPERHAFSIERRRAAGPAGDGAVVVPIATAGTIDGAPLVAGTAWQVEGGADLAGDSLDALVAWPG